MSSSKLSMNFENILEGFGHGIHLINSWPLNPIHANIWPYTKSGSPSPNPTFVGHLFSKNPKPSKYLSCGEEDTTNLQVETLHQLF